jgi:carbon monoxide dehydrogenase subunit G
MKLEQSFEVSAPLQRVWDTLVDVERVAPCLPGAAVTGRNDDGSYNGEFKVKIGPTSASYSGKLKMESVDEDSHHATMQAAGTDKRGQGGAKATIQSSLERIDTQTTKVNVSTDYHITGRLARFGRGGMIEEISNRLLREFATNLQAMLAGDGEGAAETAETSEVTVDDDAAAAAGLGAGDDSAGTAERPRATPRKEDNSAAESGASDAEAASANEPPVPQAGSQGEPGDPAHSTEATDDVDVSSGRAGAPADDPFAPPVAPPPPSGTAAGNAPPPPVTPTTPPPAENDPVQGLSLVGGALLVQIKRNPIPVAGALAAILAVLALLRRRG